MEVALKVIDKTKSQQIDIDAAHKEMEILSQLRHPNVLRCYDMFESPDTLIIVLPLMKSTLYDYLKKR